MTDGRDLTDRQRQILECINSEVRRRGFPPSVREIGVAVGLSSSSTVHSHLTALEDKGYIRRDPTKPRALEVIGAARPGRGTTEMPRVHMVPVVGQVAAGAPVLATENIETTIPLPDELADDATFILKVKGDSMIEAGLLEGDFLVVRQQQTADNGDIVVALLGDEATVKRFYRESGRIRLQPENASMEPIYTTDVLVLGKVISLFRRL
jgi:repressor LexA